MSWLVIGGVLGVGPLLPRAYGLGLLATLQHTLGLLGYGIARFGVEYVREADAQFEGSFLYTTIHMGQLLTLPMIIGGIYFIATAKRRRVRVEGTAGTASIA